MSRPTARPMSTGVAARNGSNPRLPPAAVWPVSPRSRRSQAAASAMTTTIASNTSRRGADPEDRRIVALEIAARSAGRPAQVAASRRAVAPSATRIAPIDDRALGRALTTSPARARPIRAAGTVISSPSHSCAASNCPLEAPRPRARASAGRRATDDEDADETDRTGGHGQRSDRGDRQGRLGRRPLLEIALDEAEEPRANEHPPGTDRAGRDERGVEPAQVRHQDVQLAGIEPVDIDEQVPAIAVRQVEPDQVVVGLRREDGRREGERGCRRCRRWRRRRGSGRRTSSGQPDLGPRTSRRPRRRPPSTGRGKVLRRSGSPGSTAAGSLSPTATPIASAAGADRAISKTGGSGVRLGRRLGRDRPARASGRRPGRAGRSSPSAWRSVT